MFFDQSLFQAIYSLSHKYQLLDWLFIFLASHLSYLLGIIFVILIFLKGGWQRFYLFSLAILSVIISWGVITELMRYFFYRPRPFIKLGFEPLIDPVFAGSMPSGHMMFFVPLGLVLLYLNRRIGLRFLGAVLFVGVARIFVGIHWPTDILVGIILGALSFYLARWLLPKPSRKISK